MPYVIYIHDYMCIYIYILNLNENLIGYVPENLLIAQDVVY